MCSDFPWECWCSAKCLTSRKGSFCFLGTLVQCQTSNFQNEIHVLLMNVDVLPVSWHVISLSNEKIVRRPSLATALTPVQAQTTNLRLLKRRCQAQMPVHTHLSATSSTNTHVCLTKCESSKSVDHHSSIIRPPEGLAEFCSALLKNPKHELTHHIAMHIVHEKWEWNKWIQHTHKHTFTQDTEQSNAAGCN